MDKPVGLLNVNLNVWMVGDRGGVEDIRLEAKDKKKSEAKAKNSPSEDRPSRGQGQECRGKGQGPRAQATCVLQKKDLKKFFV